MANKTSFTSEEWATLLKSPTMAGLYIVAADPSGPVGALKESFAMGKSLAEIKLDTANTQSELVKALVQDMTTEEGRSHTRPTELLGMSPEQARTHAISLCQQASALVASKSPGEAAAFNQWLLSIAKRVAEAAKEGGFLGFGGTQVSEQEAAALTELGKHLNAQA